MGRASPRPRGWWPPASASASRSVFLGFTVVGGEYFAMWQSKDWNGQQSAFRIYMTMLAVLVYVSLPEPEPGSSTSLSMLRQCTRHCL